eukprot:14862011-Ditylum_brightwellii.AAC.1
MLRNERWFSKKQKKPLKKGSKGVNNGLYIQPDSLIQCYNKWFVSEEENCPWVNDTSKKINVKVL